MDGKLVVSSVVPLEFPVYSLTFWLGKRFLRVRVKLGSSEPADRDSRVVVILALYLIPTPQGAPLRRESVHRKSW